MVFLEIQNCLRGTNKVVGTFDPLDQNPTLCLANVPRFALFFILKASLSVYNGKEKGDFVFGSENYLL